jgi:hypothetical protein
VIWLAWRRHRLPLLVLVGVTVALGLWMAYVTHSYDALASVRTAPHIPSPSELARLSDLRNQSSVIAPLLLFLPCLFGVVLGAPLIAGEYRGHTNRVAWTQGVSRTRWLFTTWSVVGLVAVALAAVLVPVEQWWSNHATVAFAVSLFGVGFGHLRPETFAVTGVAPVVYTLFAFTLGAALGALLRRTAWAVVGTVGLYGLLALLMTTTIRPDLAPQAFIPFGSNGSAYAPLTSGPLQLPWDLGSGFRFVPGTRVPAGSPSAGTIGLRCENEPTGFTTCMASHRIQDGEFLQAADHYWTLQWRESAIYLGLAVLLFGVTLLAVRRMRE